MTDNNDEKHVKDNDEDGAEHEEHDPYFEPVIHLPEVHIYSMEEDEDELVKLRAKLFRYDKSEEPHQWKERGTGEIKILWHTQRKTVRVLMRRDKTWKICANHYITPWMELKPNCDSDRAWVWSVPADFADETPKPELLAARFANAENAMKFKEAFEDGKKIAEIYANGEESSEEENKKDKEEEKEDKKEKESAAKEKPSEESVEEKEVSEKLSGLKVADQPQSENTAVDH